MKRPPVLLAAFFVLQFVVGAISKKTTALPMSGNKLLLVETFYSPRSMRRYLPTVAATLGLLWLTAFSSPKNTYI